MSKPFHPGIKNAHDVRHLTICPICNQLGDGRWMAGGKHGRCILDTEGIDGLLRLPKEEADRLCLGDIGPSAMRALVNRSASRD
jgi:hypothetical protein